MKLARAIALIALSSFILIGCNKSEQFTGTAPGWFESSDMGPFNNIVSYGSYLIAAGSQGIFRSTDCGLSWTAADTSLPSGNFRVAAAGNVLVAADNGPLGAFVSTDSGATWVRDDSGFASIADQPGYYPAVTALAGYGPDVFIGFSGSGLYRASDPATVWSTANTGMGKSAVLAFGFLGTHIFAGSADGIYHSSDGGNSWTAVNDGLANNTYSPGTIPPITDLVATGTKIYAASLYGSVFVSNDYGKSWTDISAGLPNNKGKAAWIAARDSLLLAGDSIGIYLTCNNGSTWENITDNISSPGISRIFISGEFIFASGSDGVVWRRPL